MRGAWQSLTWRALRAQVLDDDGSGTCRPWATPGRGAVTCVDVAEGTRVVAAATVGGTLAALDLAQPGGQVRPARRAALPLTPLAGAGWWHALP